MNTRELWNVSTEFYVRDARSLAAQNPGFLPIGLIFNHNKVLVRQFDHDWLFNGINTITDLLEGLSETFSLFLDEAGQLVCLTVLVPGMQPSYTGIEPLFSSGRPFNDL